MAFKSFSFSFSLMVNLWDMIVTTINFMALAYGKLMKIGLVIVLNLNKVNYH